jgi:hypothetical protein
MYGYPEFTDSIRRKIFGLTGSKLYRVDPAACRYKVKLSDLMAQRMELDEVFGPRRHAFNPPVIRTRREFLDFRLGMRRRNELG